MDNMATIHITRMPHKKYKEANFTILINENEVGILSPSESLQSEVHPFVVKLTTIVDGKSFSRECMADSFGDYYYNIEIREPKWHFYTKIILSLVGLGLIIAGLVIDPGEKPDYTLFIFVFMIFLAFVNKFEQPTWEEVSLK
jgi:hypothetical protein